MISTFLSSHRHALTLLNARLWYPSNARTGKTACPSPKVHHKHALPVLRCCYSLVNMLVYCDYRVFWQLAGCPGV